MIEFLKSIFGTDICISPYRFPQNTPMYIRDSYDIRLLTWKTHQCILLIPKDDSWRLPALKKQYMNFQKLCEMPCALFLNNLTAMQRRNLVESGISFLSESQQIYFPFWGCFFVEKFNSENKIPKLMAPGTQLAFLYLYYMNGSEYINVTELSRKLFLSKATCTRAIKDLSATGIIAVKKEGRNKWIVPQFNKPEFLKKGYNRLRSPIDRVIYVKKFPSGQQFFQSGVQALSSISMVGARESDGGIAVSKKGAFEILRDNMISKREFEDFGGTVVEVWIYDPALLSDGGRVDDISLLLSLDNDPDERIQIGLDEIRKRYELPIKYNE